MSRTNKQDPVNGSVKTITRLLLCLGVLTAAWIGMRALAMVKEPPSEVSAREHALPVRTIRALPLDHTATLTGYGVATPLDVVGIAPEVSGRVIDRHPRLEEGEVIDKGDILFKVDPHNYGAALQEAQAGVKGLEKEILRLGRQLALDGRRLKTLQRNRELTKAEFLRTKELFERSRVGTRNGVEAAEQAFNRAVDEADRLAQALELLPLHIEETENRLTAAGARLFAAKTDLDRCEIRAPFRGRVKEVFLERGQYVHPGERVLTLADDSMLEIRVPLDAREAEKWLPFRERTPHKSVEGAGALFPVSCRVMRTGGDEKTYCKGTLHRVVSFKSQTRTLVIAVRVRTDDAMSPVNSGLPLMDGMFCTVTIPGRTIRNVFRLPHETVTFDHRVLLANDNHLKTVSVRVVHREEESVYVKAGLNPGDRIIVTRITNPMENALLRVLPEEDGKGEEE